MSALLESWLAVATRKLSEESTVRVRAEIEEHHGSAVANGATDEQAISALGDAVQANRAYRKVLLTEADVKWLKLVKRRAEAPINLWYLMLANGLIGGIGMALRGDSQSALRSLSVATMAIVFLLPHRVRIDTMLRGYWYRTLRLAVMLSLPVIFAKTWDWNPAISVCAWLVMGVPLIWATYKDYRLRRKLPTTEWPKELYL